METADAVIIGGGLIGASIAFRLSGLLDKVILLERGDIGGATSGSCDKAVFLQSKKPGYPITLAKASREIYEHLEEELGYSFEFKQSGGMIVIETGAHKEFMEKFVQRQNAAGIDVKMLDRKEALEKQPCLSPHIAGATFSGEDAEVNPLLLTQGFAFAAERKGADIRNHTEVLQILTDNHQVTGVHTTKGTISTRLVVDATGPFANELLEKLSIKLPIVPRRGVILITEKLKPVINGSMLCSQYIMSKHLAEADPSNVPAYGIGLSLGQTESGNLLIGGSREFVGFNRKVQPAILQAIANHAKRIVPMLGDVSIIRTMAGFRPYTGDGLPIIDKVPQIDGLIIAAGHEGDGIALAPITGKLVASLLENKDADLLQPLTLTRFSKE